MHTRLVLVAANISDWLRVLNTWYQVRTYLLVFVYEYHRLEYDFLFVSSFLFLLPFCLVSPFVFFPSFPSFCRYLPLLRVASRTVVRAVISLRRLYSVSFRFFCSYLFLFLLVSPLCSRTRYAGISLA